MKRLTLALGLLSLAAVLAACSGATAADTTPSPASSGGPSSDAVLVTARDLRFTTPQVTVPAGTPFELTFDNQDGAPHNVAIYTDASASTRVSVGEVFSGPSQRTQLVPALTAGIYFFRCDVHQDMTGTIVAR